MTETYNQMLARLRESSRHSRSVLDNVDMMRIIEHQARLIELAREAIAAISTNPAWHLSDWIYDVKENVDFERIPDGKSSWDHPDVVAFGDAVKKIDRALAELSGDKSVE